MKMSESLSYRISTKYAEDLWGTWKGLYISLRKINFTMNIRG
jgi:hypothetical protein